MTMKRALSHALYVLGATSLFSVWSSDVSADDADQFIEEITIVGDRAQTSQITGSAQYIGLI